MWLDRDWTLVTDYDFYSFTVFFSTYTCYLIQKKPKKLDFTEFSVWVVGLWGGRGSPRSRHLQAWKCLLESGGCTPQQRESLCSLERKADLPRSTWLTCVGDQLIIGAVFLNTHLVFTIFLLW